MTRFTLAALMAVIPGFAIRAQEPKTVRIQLEGSWCEPMKAGEILANKISVRFAGEKVTINLVGETFEGTFQIEETEPSGTITLVLAATEDRTPRVMKTYNGAYLMEGGRLFLRINPYSDSSGRYSPNLLRVAPLTFRLEKVKK